MALEAPTCRLQRQEEAGVAVDPEEVPSLLSVPESESQALFLGSGQKKLDNIKFRRGQKNEREKLEIYMLH